MIEKIWNSPTFTTWGSFLSRLLGMVILLPYILVEFSDDELNIWFLIAIVTSLVRLLDMGFSQTFIRVLSYARAGSSVQNLSSFAEGKETNFDTVKEIYSTMVYIYKIIAFIVFLVLLLVGTFYMEPFFEPLESFNKLLFAWFILVITSSVFMYGSIFSSFLQGMNHIPILRRWEIFTSLGNIFTSILILFFNGELYSLILVQQFWILFGVLRNKYLINSLQYNKDIFNSKNIFNKIVFEVVWSSAWKSGIGVLMSFGVIQASGLVYAGIGDKSQITSYLFGLRIIQIISEFARAPFYSKIPLMATLYAKNNMKSLLFTVKRSMHYSNLTFFIVFVTSYCCGNDILLYLGSNVTLPDHLLWSLFGLAFFIERYGAMHMQFYSLTNIIVWHIANSIAGSIFLLLSLILYKYFEVYAFLIAFIVSNTVYSIYTTQKSYNRYKLNFFKFDFQALIIGLLLISLIIQTLIGLRS